ncbi:hypothetical protein RDI58_019885 [Solanum bulbocastanum]|uniref:Uncharacterized protein n=1 Tax=Solanum bulbocastanum TaxID=147425 RepID=A0AAN8T8Y7_SOLBU
MPTLHYKLVRWKKPQEGWVTCNTDGAIKRNPRQSSYGYCIRDKRGDLIYVEAQSIGEAPNTEAKSKQAVKGPTKGERQGDLSEPTTSIRQRDRHKEARELTGSLLFDFNRKRKGSRSQIRKKKEEEGEEFLHGAS